MRYPMFQVGDRAYVKSEVFPILGDKTVRLLLQQKRVVTVLQRRPRVRGQTPRYVASLGDWMWTVEAQYLMKIERKKSV